MPLKTMKLSARVICRLLVLRLIRALINPPEIKIRVLPAEAEAPALSGNSSIALDVAAGRVMVVPAVQIIIGTSMVKTERPNWFRNISITNPATKISDSPITICVPASICLFITPARIPPVT